MSARSKCDVTEWVLTEDRRFHVSLTNLPLGVWAQGRTFCHQDLWVFRTVRLPVEAQAEQICEGCASELVAMGETLPGWMTC